MCFTRVLQVTDGCVWAGTAFVAYVAKIVPVHSRQSSIPRSVCSGSCTLRASTEGLVLSLVTLFGTQTSHAFFAWVVTAHGGAHVMRATRVKHAAQAV